MNPLLKSRLVATVVIVLVFLRDGGRRLAHHALLDRGWPGFGLAGPPHHGSPPEMKSWMLAPRPPPEPDARAARAHRYLLTRREADIRASCPRPGRASTRSPPDPQRDPGGAHTEQQQKFAEITKQMDAGEVRGTRDDAAAWARASTGALPVAALSVAAV